MRRPGYLGDLSDTWFGDLGKSSHRSRKKRRRRVAASNKIWCAAPEAKAGKCCVGEKAIWTYMNERRPRVAPTPAEREHISDCNHAWQKWQGASFYARQAAAAKAKSARKAHPGPPPPSPPPGGFQKNRGFKKS